MATVIPANGSLTNYLEPGYTVTVTVGPTGSAYFLRFLNGKMIDASQVLAGSVQTFGPYYVALSFAVNSAQAVVSVDQEPSLSSTLSVGPITMDAG